MTKRKTDKNNRSLNENKRLGRVFQYKKTRDAGNEGGHYRGRGRFNDNGRDQRDYPRDQQGKRRDWRGDNRGYRNDNMYQNQYHNNGNRMDPEAQFNQYKENEAGFAYEVLRSPSGVNFEPIPLMSVKVPTPQPSTPQPSTSQPTEVPVARDIKPICGTEATLSQNQHANNSSGSEPSSPSTEPESKPKPEIKTKTEAKSKPNIMIDVKKIKKEKPDPVPTPPPKKVVSKKESSSSDSSSSSSDSSSSDSSEEAIPPMPKPLKPSKKEKSKKGDDVVCLGKQENIESLIDDTECLVCKSDSHSSGQCTKKCIKCSHSSYSTQIVCNTCGETYPAKANATATTVPNPFLMFMQFMQFCMGQYFDFNKEMSQPIPPPVPVVGNSQEVEVTRQDIVDNARRHRKKSKSELKSRKKRKSEKSSDSESDSDSSSKATVSTKKRKKISAPQPTTPSTAQSRPQMMPNMSGTLPSMQNYPFGAGFNNTGFNPMMAFSQMMGMQPGTAMNFQQ